MKKRILLATLIFIIVGAYWTLVAPEKEKVFRALHLCIKENTNELVVGTNHSAYYVRKVNYVPSHDTLNIELYRMSIYNFLLKHEINPWKVIDMNAFSNVSTIAVCDSFVKVETIQHCTGNWE